MKLPIKKWSKTNCFIWLWVTNSKDKKTKEPIIKTGFDLLNHWGFSYYTTITWDKKTGPCPFGPYQITTEHILFGYKGTAKFEKECLGKMKTNLILIISLLGIALLFFISEIFSLKKEVRKLNKIVGHLLKKDK